MNELLENYRRQFEIIDKNLRELLAKIPDDKIFVNPLNSPRTMQMFSCGEYLLRSAAAVEQTFGGITAKLWDDPFEWTLPEELATKRRIAEYLSEVEATREKGFAFFVSDNDLKKKLPAPEKIKTINELLLETIARARHFEGRAFAVFQIVTGDKPPNL